MAADSTPPALAAVERWRAALAGTAGWPRRLVALVLGALSAAMLPPVHAFPLLVIVFPALLWLIDGIDPVAPRRRRFWRGFWIGWWFGVGFFAAGLYWMAFPFLVDAATYGWMIPFALTGLSAGLAIFTGVSVGLTAISARGLPARAIWLAVWWIALEWLRGWIFTGFPWNFAGTIWTFAPSMLQSASLVGVFGLGFVTVAAGAMPAVLGDRAMVPARRLVVTAIAIAVFGAMWAGGALRLSGADAAPVDGVRLRLVQPDVPQKEKWIRELRPRHIRRMIEMSREPGANGPPTHVIWPETAVTYFLDRLPELRRALAEAAPPGGALITGAIRAGIAGGRITQLWNSLHVIDSKGDVVATYDKAHLVPFGEYVPFGKYLPVTKITAGRTDFSAGPGPVALPVPGAPPFSPLICYEATFPGAVVPHSGTRPQWLLNVTNDAWFGDSSGPYQHFASAQLRAVEEGLPMVRVANTGISAVVDSYGRVIASLGLNARGVVDSDLPKPVPGITLYAKFGNATVFVVLLIASIAAWYFDRRHQRG